MFAVVWPRGSRHGEMRGFAKRLDTLEGKTIGLLWNWDYRGDEIFPMVEKELTKRHAGIKVIGYNAFGNFFGPHEAEVFAALGDKLRHYHCDAVICGVGC